MSSLTDTTQPIKRPSLNLAVLGAIVLIAGLAGSLLVMRFSQVEQQRALLQWQNKLNLIADSRTESLSQWLDASFRQLGDVASNPSLQLYLTTLLAPIDTSKPAEDPAQTVFLRNLLVMTGNRLGFLDPAPAELKSIPANVAKPSGTGLALIGMDGKVLVSTEGLSAPAADLMARITAAPTDKPSLIDLFKAEDSSLRIGFTFPVYPIQGDEASSKPIARLVGIRKTGDEIAALLRHPGVNEPTLEAVLLRREGQQVVTLIPDNGMGGQNLSTPDLDAAIALQQTGSFAQAHDASFTSTLMTSRAVANAPWTLMVRIQRDHALAESDAWRRQMQWIMGLAILAALCGLVAVWYYGTSRRIWLLSQETTRLARKLGAQEKLLRVVADNQLEPILLVDPENVVHFANAPAASDLHLQPQDVDGKDIVALFGPARGTDYCATNKVALTMRTPQTRTWRKTTDGGETVIRSLHIPLDKLPVETLDAAGVLMIDQDVTDVVTERERRLSLSQQLINTLVSMVDSRDHNAAHHSAGVALLAREVAQSMALPPVLCETAETAGKLMNIGKIVVPPELLTKTGPLAQDEKAFILESVQRSADLIANIAFEGPVVDTLRQAQEHFDGSGPMHMKGDAILVTARIIAVANAFVGMVSPRAYRATMTMQQALHTLIQDCDTHYDNRVVVALAHFMENQSGKDILARLIAKAE